MKDYCLLIASIIVIIILSGCSPPRPLLNINNTKGRLNSTWNGNSVETAFDVITNMMFDLDIEVHPTETNKPSGKIVANKNGKLKKIGIYLKSNKFTYDVLITQEKKITNIKMKINARIYYEDSNYQNRLHSVEEYNIFVENFNDQLRKKLISKFGKPNTFNLILEKSCNHQVPSIVINSKQYYDYVKFECDF